MSSEVEPGRTLPLASAERDTFDGVSQLITGAALLHLFFLSLAALNMQRDGLDLWEGLVLAGTAVVVVALLLAGRALARALTLEGAEVPVVMRAIRLLLWVVAVKAIVLVPIAVLLPLSGLLD